MRALLLAALLALHTASCGTPVQVATNKHYTVCVTDEAHAAHPDVDVYLREAIAEWFHAGLGGLTYLPPSNHCHVPVLIGELVHPLAGATTFIRWANGFQPVRVELDEPAWTTFCHERRRQLVLHEIGHALGLDHPEQHAVDDVMAPTVSSQCDYRARIYR